MPERQTGNEQGKENNLETLELSPEIASRLGVHLEDTFASPLAEIEKLINELQTALNIKDTDIPDDAEIPDDDFITPIKRVVKRLRETNGMLLTHTSIIYQESLDINQASPQRKLRFGDQYPTSLVQNLDQNPDPIEISGIFWRKLRTALGDKYNNITSSFMYAELIGMFNPDLASITEKVVNEGEKISGHIQSLSTFEKISLIKQEDGSISLKSTLSSPPNQTSTTYEQ